MAAWIRLRGFGFRYAGAERPVLDGIELDLSPGACLLVLGPSGSGKSTLALGLAGLLGDDVPGEVHGTLERSADVAGLVFQDADRQLVMEWVDDDVAFGLESRGWPLPAMRGRVPDALAQVGLEDRARAPVPTLSGGERQRLALAGALAPDPALLVLDEPTANLDPAGAAAFLERLAALKRSGSTTLAIVEHRVDDVWPLADLLLVLGRDGRPLAVGPPDEVVREHGARLVREGVWLPTWLEAAAQLEAAARPSALPGGELLVAAGPAPVQPPCLEVSGLRFAYRPGPPVLEDLDLVVRSGERVAIVGRNGSGKSTLARLLVGLMAPDGGRISIESRTPRSLPPAARAALAGLVFQDPELGFLASTVDEEIRLGLPPGPSLEAGAEALMAELGLPLPAFGPRSPYRLSGGEQRRLSLAPALLRRPRLLVLDEPTFGQDRLGVESLVERVRSEAAAGTAVVAVSHDERFVAMFADRVLELRDGRLYQRAAT